jgi:hypothetical protein
MEKVLRRLPGSVIVVAKDAITHEVTKGMGLLRDTLHTGIIVAALVWPGTTAISQSSSVFELPKIGEPRMISLSSNGNGSSRLAVADENGKVQQSLELWEDQSRNLNVITYMLVGLDLKSFSVTWGRGAINPAAFACRFDNPPIFSEKSIWVATANNGILSVQEIQDGDVKGMFRDVNQLRLRNDRNRTQVGKPGLIEQNIMIFMKEKNRKKWLERGWLTPTNTCVRHF